MNRTGQTLKCDHSWGVVFSMDSNPPQETRECELCGEVQSRWGKGIAMDYSVIEPTPWETVRG